MEKVYLVSGCGITVECADRDSALRWCKEIIAKGGVPVVKATERQAAA